MAREPCPECGTAYDETKTKLALKRNLKSYLEYVADSAVRQKKDPEMELQKVKRLRRFGFFNVSDSMAINRKLREFLKRRGYKSRFNNKEL